MTDAGRTSEVPARTVFPPTAERVRMRTPPEVQERIDRRSRGDVEAWRLSGETAVERRMDELDREWDLERALETQDGLIFVLFALVGLVSGRRRWYLVPLVVGFFLLQHALLGWCLAQPFYRRLGFRTPYEIAEERCALKHG